MEAYKWEAISQHVRNEFVFQGTTPSATVLSRCAQSMLQQFRQGSSGNISFKRSSSTQWELPKPATIKVNCDGSFKTDQQSSIGAIVRDDGDVTLGVVSGPIQGCCMVEEVEAAAIVAGMRLAQKLHCSKVIVETDCSKVLKEITCSDISYAIFGDLVTQIIKALIHSFSWCRFRHVPRSCNKAADYLANVGHSLGDRHEWIDHIPPFLPDVIS